jgi:hypothetical protein
MAADVKRQPSAAEADTEAGHIRTAAAMESAR